MKKAQLRAGLAQRSSEVALIERLAKQTGDAQVLNIVRALKNGNCGNRVLGLVRRGRPPSPLTHEQNFWRVVRVRECWHDGMTIDNAIHAVADELHAAPSTLAKHYKLHWRDAERYLRIEAEDEGLTHLQRQA